MTPAALPKASPALAVVVGLRDESRPIADLADTVEALRAQYAAAAAARGLPTPRLTQHGGVAIFDVVPVTCLLATLDRIARKPAAVCGLWLSAPANHRLAALRAVFHARETRAGFYVSREPFDGSSEPIAALLHLHMTLARARTPAQWRAIAAVNQHGTVTEAARALGCSHQAVSKAHARANADITNATAIALAALLRRGA